MIEGKTAIIKSLAINSNDTGSSEVQIGLLSEKIKKQYDSDINDLKKEIISAKAKAYKELEK